MRVETEQLQRNLARFLRACWPLIEGGRELKWNWHLDAVCDHLQALADGTLGKRKVIFNVPPRTSKSTIVTIVFPIWLWTRQPWLQFMFASYSFSLSRDHAYKRRSVLESPWFKSRWGEKVSISGDRNNIVEIANSRKGLMYTTGVEGSIMGRGGDYLILDDPNDAEQMESEVQRASILRFIDAGWSTRANDPKTVREVVIQQRTHEKDVTGHLLGKHDAHEWEHVKIPMEYNPDSPCRTAIWKDPRTVKGEILDPERFPSSYIEGRKIALGPYNYAGQYDQEPAPLGGGIVKASWLRPWQYNARGEVTLETGYSFPVFDVQRFATVDLAFTEDEIGEKKVDDPDYTVMAAWACFRFMKGVILVLLDLIRERMEGPEIITTLETFHKKWRFGIIGFETIQAQKALFQYAYRAGLPVREISTKIDDDVIYRVDKDKVSRLVAATPLMAQGHFFVPLYSAWRGDFNKELCRFPNTAHDDQCDVVSCAIPIAQKLAVERILPPDIVVPKRPTAPEEASVKAIGSTDWRREWPGSGGGNGDERPPGEVNNFGRDGR